MVLGVDKVLKLINDPKVRLISNVGERELREPEGSVIDLRIGRLYRIRVGETGFINSDTFQNGVLELGERRTPEVEVVSSYDRMKPSSEQEFCTILPGEYYLLETLEQFRLPVNLQGVVFSRTTLFRQGLDLICSVVAPGYGLRSDDPNGAILTFGLKNISNCIVRLQMGARVAQITFETIQGMARPYRGQWQKGKGRIRTETERQQ